MEKKFYNTPETRAVNKNTMQIFAVSKDMQSSEQGIGYGGTDDGTVVPDSKEQGSWGDMWK